VSEESAETVRRVASLLARCTSIPPIESASNCNGGLEKRQSPNGSGGITETVGQDGVFPSRRLNLQITATADWKNASPVKRALRPTKSVGVSCGNSLDLGSIMAELHNRRNASLLNNATRWIFQRVE